MHQWQGKNFRSRETLQKEIDRQVKARMVDKLVTGLPLVTLADGSQHEIVIRLKGYTVTLEPKKAATDVQPVSAEQPRKRRAVRKH